MMAKASSKTETVEQTTVTLIMTEDEAFAIHALASHGDDLPSGHPLHNGSRAVYLVLDTLFQGGDTFARRVELYNSIDVDESADS
jgi:hypothetical protein